MHHHGPHSGSSSWPLKCTDPGACLLVISLQKGSQYCSVILEQCTIVGVVQVIERVLSFTDPQSPGCLPASLSTSASRSHGRRGREQAHNPGEPRREPSKYHQRPQENSSPTRTCDVVWVCKSRIRSMITAGHRFPPKISTELLCPPIRRQSLDRCRSHPATARIPCGSRREAVEPGKSRHCCAPP